MLTNKPRNIWRLGMSKKLCKWLPIDENFPRDKISKTMLFYANTHVIGYYSVAQGAFIDDVTGNIIQPTHYMPLVSPPLNL